MVGMTIVMIGIVWVFIIFLLEEIGHRRVHRNKTKKVIDNPRPESGMTWASRQLLKEYNELPLESRPYDDIKPMLRALDIKHEDMGDSYSGAGYYCWAYFSTENPYRVLHHQIERIQNAIADQNRALEEKAHRDRVDEVAADLDMLEDLQYRLLNEARARQEATKELRNS